MKLFYSLLTIATLSFSLNTRSEDPLGGQSGNGGNGCWIREGSRFQWKSIEELIHPEHFELARPFSQAFSLPASSVYQVRSMDLTKIIQAKKAFKRLDRLSVSAPKIYGILAEMIKLFEHVYVVQTNISGVFEGDISRLYPKCLYYSPAVVTLDDGTILFFKPTWDRLSSLSSEIILVHETIRLAQLLHPAFKDLSNADLQELTALLFSTRRVNFRIQIILNSIEQTLREGSIPFPYDKGYINTVWAIRSQVDKAIQNKKALGESLNDLRKNHPGFREAVENNIKKILQDYK